MRYRLLDTTRAYALEINVDEAEFAARHATYYRGWLEQNRTEWSSLSTGTERAPHLDGVNNVRAALEWCFGVNGNSKLASVSPLPPCRFFGDVVAAGMSPMVGAGNAGARRYHSRRTEEMHLQAGIGISSMQMQGEGDAARLALNRSLAIAEERDDALHQAALLGTLHMFHFRGGDFKTALYYGKRCRALANSIDDPAAITLAYSILGRSLLVMGDLGAARIELEAAADLVAIPADPLDLSGL